MRAALLGVSTFKLTPVTHDVTMTWHLGSTKPEYAMMPPASHAMFAHAVRLDMVRRSAYVTGDGSSVYIVDTSGPLQETRWFGPMSWSYVTQLCQEAVSTWTRLLQLPGSHRGYALVQPEAFITVRRAPSFPQQLPFGAPVRQHAFPVVLELDAVLQQQQVAGFGAGPGER